MTFLSQSLETAIMRSNRRRFSVFRLPLPLRRLIGHDLLNGLNPGLIAPRLILRSPNGQSAVFSGTTAI